MSRGPIWTPDEDRICKYLWNNRDLSLTDTEVDEYISNVLKTRDPNAIRIYRNRKGYVHPKKKPDVLPTVKDLLYVSPKKAQSDSLPDVGQQIAKLIEKQTMIEQTVWAINIKLAENNEHAKLLIQLMKENLDLWRSIDARRKAPE
jgi:hypothetical protein